MMKKQNPKILAEDFKNLVKTSLVVNSETMENQIIQQCLIFWIDNFQSIPKNEISKYPIKTEAQIFLKNLLPIFSFDLAKNSFNPNYLMCIDSLSLFIPQKENCNEIFFSFLRSLLSITIQIDTQSLAILLRFLVALLSNKSFHNFILKQDTLLLLWSNGMNRPQYISKIVFSFLTDAIRTTKLKKTEILTDTFQLLMIQSLKQINQYGLAFICFCYRYYDDYLPLFEDNFDLFVDAINSNENGMCFSDLLFVKTKNVDLVINSFYELASSGSVKLVRTLLDVVSQYQQQIAKSGIHIQMIMFLKSVSKFDRDGQFLFLSLIPEDIFYLLFPPSISKIDCSCLAVFSKMRIDRERAIKYLNLILISNNSIENGFDKALKESFENDEGFDDLIICLLGKLDTFDSVTEYFTHLCYAKTSKIIPCIDFICASFPPVSFLTPFLDYLQEMKDIGYFHTRLPITMKENITTLTSELLKNEQFVEFVIQNEIFEVIQVLSSDGPHKIIDKYIKSSDIPSKLTQDQLKCLIYNLPFDTIKVDNFISNKNRKMIRIPSLIPFLDSVEFNSLFDLYVASKYLITCDFISIDDRLFASLGKQYLTDTLISDIISNRPDILDKITQPNLNDISRSVYQFEQNTDDSFITYNFPACIEFKLDKSFLDTKSSNSKSLVLCSFFDYLILITSQSKLVFCSFANSNITCTLDDCDITKWHTLTFIKKNALMYEVQYDGKSLPIPSFTSTSINSLNLNFEMPLLNFHSSNLIKATALLTVGSNQIRPKCTFYVAIKQSNTIIQMGNGIYTTSYRGIYYYKNLLNIENCVIKKAMRTEKVEDFEHLILSLIRLSRDFRYDHMEKHHKVHVTPFDRIRQLLILKTPMISSHFLTQILTELTNFNLYQMLHLFIDYDLWMNADFSVVFNFICNMLVTELPLNSEYANKKQAVIDFYFNFILDIREYAFNPKFDYKSINISALFAISNSFIPRLFEYLTFCDDYFRTHKSSLIKMIPLRYIVFLSKATALEYLNQYSLMHLNENFVSDEDIEIFISQLSFYSDLVNERSLWNSFINLLFGQKSESIQILNSDLRIKNEKILRIYFALLPNLAKLTIQQHNEQRNDQISVLFYDVIEFVKTLLADRKVRSIRNYTRELSGLIRMNCYSSTISFLPILFNRFESGRVAVNAHDILPEAIQQTTDFSKQIPKIVNDTYTEFGLNIPYNFPTNKANVEQEIESTFNDFDSYEYKQLFEIVLIIFGLYGNDFDFGSELIQNLFTFGIDSSTKSSMDFHQACVRLYINRNGLDKTILTYLNEVVLVGFWENNLLHLLNLILKNYSIYIESSSSLLKKPQIEESTGVESDILVCELVLKIFILLTEDEFAKIPQESLQFILCNMCNIEKSGNSESTNELIKSKFPAVYLHYARFIFTVMKNKIAPIELNQIVGTNLTIIQDTNGNPQTEVNEDQNYLAYQKSNENELLKLNKKYIEIRKRMTLTFYPEPYLIDLNYKKKELSESYRHSYELRYNYFSQRNEKVFYDICINVPKDLTGQYQLVSTSHPFSPSTLYVPYYSKCNCSNFHKYPKFEQNINIETNSPEENIELIEDFYDTQSSAIIQESGLIEERIPRILFYNYNFTNTKYPLNDTEITAYFRVFESNFEKLEDISLIYSSEMIDCVLLRHKSKFFIITHAQKVDKNTFKLLRQKSTLLSVSLIDCCISGYYGKTSLFFGHLVLIFDQRQITISIPRIFCFKKRAIEIWFDKGYSLYLIFKHGISLDDELEACLRPLKKLPYSKSMFSLSFSSEVTNSVRNRSDLVKFRIKWINNRISSFAYLLILNFYADRSFANICQYFVMPWVSDMRDLSKPMGMQTKARADDFREKYQTSYPDYHFFGSLYSSPPIVMRLLMRIQPYTNFLMDLQNGFDKADRLFFDIETEFKSAAGGSNHNVEELIPELFMLPEIYLNTNRIPIPKRMRGQCISDCYLPKDPINDPNPLSPEEAYLKLEQSVIEKVNKSNAFANQVNDAQSTSKQNIEPNNSVDVPTDISQSQKEANTDLHSEASEQDNSSKSSQQNIQLTAINPNQSEPENLANEIQKPTVSNHIASSYFELSHSLNDSNIITEEILTDDDQRSIRNWVQFVWEYRKKLDDTPNLEKWIDLIFGVYSRGNSAVQKENLFYPSTYGIKPEIVDQACFESMMMNFGQVPTQLFYEEHPKKNTIAFARWPQLHEVDCMTFEMIESSIINHKSTNEVNHFNSFGLYGLNESFSICNCMKIVEDKNKIPLVEEIDTSQFDCCSFSIDQFFFCVVFEYGTIFVYRAICEHEKKISCYKKLSTCYLPTLDEHGHNTKATCVSVSSHLFLVCEAIENVLICFHLNGTYIRSIKCKSHINKVFINDSYQCIFCIQDYFIDVFTINGTPVASINTNEQFMQYHLIGINAKQDSCIILSSSISINDTGVYLATGHKNGLLLLWDVNPRLKKLNLRKIILLKRTNCSMITVEEGKVYHIEYPLSKGECDVRYIEVISNGSAIYAYCEEEQCLKSLLTGSNHSDNNESSNSMTPKTTAFLLTARGIRKQLVSEKVVLECPQCGKINDQNKKNKFSACSSCGAFFCPNCIHKTLCDNCISHIVNYSNILDDEPS